MENKQEKGETDKLSGKSRCHQAGITQWLLSASSSFVGRVLHQESNSEQSCNIHRWPTSTDTVDRINLLKFIS